jgi:ribose transport system substrate-binding protein
MQVRNGLTAALLSVALLTAVVGCSSGGNTANSGGTANQSVDAAADKALKALATTIVGKGPDGSTAASVNEVELSDSEVAQIKQANLKAAIVMHYGGNDWSTSAIAGAKAEFARLGIKVVATTDANFKPDKQVSDLETVMALKPDIIVTIPTDPVATAAEYAKVAAAGVKLVFLGNLPQGFKSDQYVSVVAADNEGNGVAAAHLMAKALGGTGTIALIYHDADFFVTNERYKGFKETIEKDYKNIKVVAEQGISGPDFASDAQAAANALLTRYPNLDGMWGVWDVPAEGIMAAARASGRTDLKVTTEDLGTNVAIAMAKKQMIVGLGAQTPYDQGQAAATLGAAGVIGRTDIPKFVALNALPVDHDNLLESWRTVYHSDPPKEVASAFAK